MDVKFQKDGIDSKELYRLYENGNYSNGIPMSSRQNRVTTGVIIGKKSWGLHVDMWSEGISEWCFTSEEILQQFVEHNIVIPQSLLTDFYNTIEKKKTKRNQVYFESLLK